MKTKLRELAVLDEDDLVHIKSLVLVVNGHSITGVVNVVVSAMWFVKFFACNKKSKSWIIFSPSVYFKASKGSFVHRFEKVYYRNGPIIS